LSKDYFVFLEHILRSIGNIEEDTKQFSKEKFLGARTIQDAVIRNIEIIGEATKNLPFELRNKYSQISWIDIVGMRDKLIHGYFGIDLNIVWKTIKEDLPKLKKLILEILKTEKD